MPWVIWLWRKINEWRIYRKIMRRYEAAKRDHR
jgi:hypothetical protein